MLEVVFIDLMMLMVLFVFIDLLILGSLRKMMLLSVFCV